MEKNSAKLYFKFIPALCLLFTYVYIVLVINPAFYLHHTQAAFLFSIDFYSAFLKYPGGLSELIGNFIMQFFYFRFFGPIVFFGIVILIGWLSLKILDRFKKKEINIVLAFIPMTLCMVLVNNYNFPFSIIVSFIIILLFSLLIKWKNLSLLTTILVFSISSLVIYYFSGSGYLLIYSILVFLLFLSKKISSIFVLTVYLAIVNYFVPLIATKYILPLPISDIYLSFYPSNLYFKVYQVSSVFYLFLFATPILILLKILIPKVQNLLNKIPFLSSETIRISVLWTLVLLIGYFSHKSSYIGDAKKIVASDFHAYNGNADKTMKAATRLKDYSFAANLNYNLAMVRDESLSENFFNFFQIKGTMINI